MNKRRIIFLKKVLAEVCACFEGAGNLLMRGLKRYALKKKYPWKR